MDIDGVGILGRGLTAKGPLGSAFENIDVRVDPGSLAIVSGASGTGRTSMLLALSGRLRLVAGHLKVAGLVLPYRAKTVRKLVVPARFSPGFELQPQHRVRQVRRERRAIGKVSPQSIDDAFALVGLEASPSTLVGDLHPADRLLLSVALAAAERPAGMLVDDVDLGLPAASRTRVWRALRTITETGMTVLTSATEPPSGEDIAIIRLSRETPDSNETTTPLPPATQVLRHPRPRDPETGESAQAPASQDSEKQQSPSRAPETREFESQRPETREEESRDSEAREGESEPRQPEARDEESRGGESRGGGSRDEDSA